MRTRAGTGHRGGGPGVSRRRRRSRGSCLGRWTRLGQSNQRRASDRTRGKPIAPDRSAGVIASSPMHSSRFVLIDDESDHAVSRHGLEPMRDDPGERIHAIAQAGLVGFAIADRGACAYAALGVPRTAGEFWVRSRRRSHPVGNRRPGLLPSFRCGTAGACRAVALSSSAARVRQPLILAGRRLSFPPLNQQLLSREPIETVTCMSSGAWGVPIAPVGDKAAMAPGHGTLYARLPLRAPANHRGFPVSRQVRSSDRAWRRLHSWPRRERRRRLPRTGSCKRCDRSGALTVAESIRCGPRLALRPHPGS